MENEIKLWFSVERSGGLTPAGLVYEVSGLSFFLPTAENSNIGHWI